LRTHLIHRLGALGVQPEDLARRLDEETDLSARRALLLALGEIPAEAWKGDARQELAERLLRLYRDESCPGLHSAVSWLLHRWGYDERLAKVDTSLTGLSPKGDRRWYINRQGQTFALVAGPVEFRMGSPGLERERYKQEETCHRRLIPRSFAVATRKVTVEQFQRFRPEHPYPASYSPDPDGPMISVSWLDAARYSRWLSEQENVPRDQMCYPPVPEIKEGMQLPADYLERIGYRLPTEAEWESACRAGAVTSRCYGSSREGLGFYAWFFDNSDDHGQGERAWPSARLKPNELGLFDVHGNVWEWCQDRYLPYPEALGGRPVLDREDTLTTVLGAHARVVRGGSFLNRAPIVRSAARNKYEPTRAYYYVGFRVVRTCPPEWTVTQANSPKASAQVAGQ
jgi:formylglycine-generating enzyme required for sulfatase activity